MFLEREHVNYGRAQLAEVICQLRFPTILRIGAAEPADFQERIRENYPRYSRNVEKQPPKLNQTPQGVRLLRSLFSAKLAGGEVSGVMAQQAIAVLVRQEDKRAPLSDQVLAERLQAQGIDISRRTVAKYRIELGIGSSTARRARNRGK